MDDGGQVHILRTAGERLNSTSRVTTAVASRLQTVAEGLVAVALIGELGVMFGNLLARSFLSYSFAWTDEIAHLCLSIIAFMGGAIAYRRGRHIAVEALRSRLPSSLQVFNRITVDWIVIIVGSMIVAYSVPLLIGGMSEWTPVLRLPLTFTVAPLTCGGAMLLIYALSALSRYPLPRTITVGGCVAFVVSGLAVTHSLWIAWLQGWPLTIAILVTLLLLIGLGVPVGFVLALLGFGYALSTGASQPDIVPKQMNDAMSSYFLLALPFFVLAGMIMTNGGIGKRIAEFVLALVGRVRGGALHAVIVSMYLFSGLSGSKVADVAAIGTTLRDLVRSDGYDDGETAAVLAASAVMGETVPPSTALLVLGSITSLSIGALFLAGVGPALITAACLSTIVYIRARGASQSRERMFQWSVVGRSSVRAGPSIFLPALLVGGIAFGIATPTEISSIAVVYGILLVVLVHREVGVQGLARSVEQTVAMSGMALFILSTATSFSWVLAMQQVPAEVLGLLNSFGEHGTVVFLAVSVVCLIIMGAFLEGLPAVIMFAPLLFPIAVTLHIDPLQYGIIMIKAMALGSFGPPIGVGFYIASMVAETSVEEATRRLAPYWFALIVSLVIVILVPEITVWLPRMVHLVAHP